MTPDKKWLTPSETAAYLGLPTVKALYQAVRRGTVPAHRLGRRLRFSSEELDRLLGGNQTGLVHGGLRRAS